MPGLILAVLTAGAAAFAVPACASIDWKNLKNPVLDLGSWGIKDYGIAWNDGTVYAFSSAFYEDDGRVRSHVIGVHTKDFKKWSEPVFSIDGREDGWIGMCSPDCSKIGDTWYLTFNSWGDKEGCPNQLFYISSKDLVNWSSRKPLAHNVTKDVRAIDAAVAGAEGKIHLIYKENQTARVAVGASMDGEFRWIGDGLPRFARRDGGDSSWHENYSFIKVANRWRLYCIGHQTTPLIYTMKGPGERDEDWLDWIDGVTMFQEKERFNTDQSTQAPALLDLSSVDGYFYMIYGGRTEGITNLGRGNYKMGLSRSTDLLNWYIAGKTQR